MRPGVVGQLVPSPAVSKLCHTFLKLLEVNGASQTLTEDIRHNKDSSVCQTMHMEVCRLIMEASSKVLRNTELRHHVLNKDTHRRTRKCSSHMVNPIRFRCKLVHSLA